MRSSIQIVFWFAILLSNSCTANQVKNHGCTSIDGRSSFIGEVISSSIEQTTYRVLESASTCISKGDELILSRGRDYIDYTSTFTTLMVGEDSVLRVLQQFEIYDIAPDRYLVLKEEMVNRNLDFYSIHYQEDQLWLPSSCEIDSMLCEEELGVLRSFFRE